MGWFNPTDVGNSSKEGRGCTKTRLNSRTCLEVARPRKSIPTLCPQKRSNNLVSVNSKVGTWAPDCSLLIQEAWPNRPKLAPLSSKSCSYCNPDRRCFKTLFGGQTIFSVTKWNWWLPWWLRQSSICLQGGRTGFDPWVGKILWRRKQQPTPVLLPGKPHLQRNLVGSFVHGVTKSWTRLSN